MALDERPLVSIVTPSYNQVSYLEATIQSVLAQDYKLLEYIIVDGASSDGSQQIIKKYSDKLAWWVSEPDSGQAEAINKGLRASKGEVVAWLNSDDLYLPGAISQAVRILCSNPNLGMVYSDAITINASGKPLNRLSFGNWGLKELMGFRIVCQPAVFMRRSILEATGFLDDSYHFMLDHQLWIRMARLAPVRYAPVSNEPGSRQIAPLWAAARHHPEAKNVSQATYFGEEIIHLLEWMQKQTDLKELISRDRKHVLAGAFRLKARYLLDGGMAQASLGVYMRALLLWPAYTLKHWRRMVYATFYSLGLGKFAEKFRKTQNRTPVELITALRREFPLIDKWPGLNLNT